MSTDLPTCDSCGSQVQPAALTWTQPLEGTQRALKVFKDRDACNWWAAVAAEVLLDRRTS